MLAWGRDRCAVTQKRIIQEEADLEPKITLILKRVLVLIEANLKNWWPDKSAHIPAMPLVSPRNEV